MGVPVVTGAIYFDDKGKNNTKPTLAAAKSRADELGIKDIVVATTSGTTAIQAAELFKDGYKLVIVTHATGFKEPNHQSLSTDNRRIITDSGAKIFTGTHAFGGVGRAVRFKFNTYEVEEIIANTLRVFSQGVKVAIEITLMAADAGLIPTDKEVIAVGGSGKGADTAIVVKPANVQRFFDLQVLEIICKPREP